MNPYLLAYLLGLPVGACCGAWMTREDDEGEIERGQNVLGFAFLWPIGALLLAWWFVTMGVGALANWAAPPKKRGSA